MKKKLKKSILTLHKEIKHNSVGATKNGDKVSLLDGTNYYIHTDGSYRKIQ